MIMKFMGDKEDFEPPPPRTGKNDKEAARLASQYDIIASELYPWIAQQYQIKLDEEEDPYEKVKESLRSLIDILNSSNLVEKDEKFTFKSERSYPSIDKENGLFRRTIKR